MNLSDFSTHQLAGMRLMAGFDGVTLNEDLKFLIRDLHVGGIILFSRNIQGPDQVRDLCREVQDYATRCGLPRLFIAIDQEGGQVARLKSPFTEFLGNPHMKTIEDAVRFAEITARELKDVHVNMNLAPVLDVAPEGMNSIMENRAFGHDPNWVAQIGATVIRHLQQNNIMAVAKHFPGIGRTVLDSHFELPDLDADEASLAEFDLPPFYAAIQNKVAGIMLSHIRYTGIDPDWPAGFSVKIADNLLRRRMGYDGLVLTDDLDMGAIKKHYDLKIAMSCILDADIDLILICHKGPDIEWAFALIADRIESEQAEFDQPESGQKDGRAQALQSARRIMQAKHRFGLL